MAISGSEIGGTYHPYTDLYGIVPTCPHGKSGSRSSQWKKCCKAPQASALPSRGRPKSDASKADGKDRALKFKAQMSVC